MAATDNFDINGILAQLLRTGPTDAERQQASSQALTRFGLGVLAGNQPSREPRNPFGVLAQGGLAGQDAYQASLDKQGAERKTNAQNALQAFQLKKQFEQQQAIQGLLSSGAPGPQPTPQPGQTPAGMSPGTAASIGAPWAANEPPAAQPRPSGPSLPPGFTDIPLSKLQALAAAGVNVEPFLKLREAAQPKLENVPGIGMVHPNTGQVAVSMPRITDTGRAAGAVPDGMGGWKVQVPQGSLGAYSQFQNADEAAKAKFDPFMGQVDPSGRPIPQTRLQFASRVSPEAAAAVAPSGAAPAAGMGPTPTQAAAAKEVGTGDAQRVQALEQKVPSMVSMLRRLDRMEGLTGDATFSASGAEIKGSLGSIAQAFNLPIAKEKTANTEEYIAHVAELLKDRLASKDYGSGSGVSNLDLISASKPLPELAKTEQGRKQIIQAIRADTQRSMGDAIAARDYFQQNMSLRGFKYPSETAPGLIPKTPGSPPAPQEVMTTRPPAAQHRGRTIMDSAGNRFKSDGMIWKPVTQ